MMSRETPRSWLHLILAALPLLLLLSGGCKSETCEMPCRSPQVCEPITRTCVGRCYFARCAAQDLCEESTGQCVVADNPPPALGDVIDRVGRPLTGALLVNPFDLIKPEGAMEIEEGNISRSRFNKDSDAQSWSQTWSPYVIYNLAILDALDGICGTSLMADVALVRYTALAEILSDDQLYLDSMTSLCSGAYLAVERRNVIGEGGMDCGGRLLNNDLVDAVYSATMNGKLSGVSDGVRFNSRTSTDFPFLSIPDP